MKIVIGTDSWPPKVCGVVRVLQTIIPILEAKGHSVHVLSPNLFRNVSCPFYPELKLALPFFSSIEKHLPKEFDAMHIMTEGPLGLQLSRYCLCKAIPFTSSYTTHIAAQLYENGGIPQKPVNRYVRWFHNRSERILVATESLKEMLQSWGLDHAVLWSRGVNTELFYPRKVAKSKEKIFLYVGRVSKEKNLESFLESKTEGKKYIVGDGPIRLALQQKYPEATFLGYLHGEKLAEMYAQADLFVFPSKTDTFGLVMLEALASGLPVAAYPIQGPIDVIIDPRLGCLSNNLEEAMEMALARGDREFCRAYAQKFSWSDCVDRFLANLITLR